MMCKNGRQKNIEVISEKAEGIETSTQHSIEITPELKAAVEKIGRAHV